MKRMLFSIALLVVASVASGQTTRQPLMVRLQAPRFFVVGDNGSEARTVAEAIVRDAFHNVSFFGGSIADLRELLEDEEG